MVRVVWVVRLVCISGFDVLPAMGTRDDSASKNIAHPIPFKPLESNVLSGGILRCFKEIR